MLKTNSLCLESALDTVAEILNTAVKPVLIAGPNLRIAKAIDAFEALATASGYAVAVMPSGKGHFRETHPHFVGTYWGAVSTSYVSEIVESADIYVFVGPIFNDYRWVCLAYQSFGSSMGLRNNLFFVLFLILPETLL